MSYTQWVSNGTNVSYVPKEKDTGEVITPFSTTASGGVPNSSYAPSTYVLAASGAWIPQTVGTSSSEVRRPTAYTLITSNGSPYFEATDTSLVYDSDTNHLTTNGRFELQGLSAQNDASFKFSSFQTKAQTWTSATLNISRNYASTRWTSGTEARYYLSTDGGTNWTLLLTDDYDNDPVTVTIFSHTLATSNPSSLSNYQVKVEIDAFSSGALGSVGVLDLQLYDIWIEGIYTVSGGTGTVTSITTTGANGVTISGGSTQTITTSGTFALALGNITPTSISTGTGSFSGDVEFAASIKSPNGSNSPVTIVPDGTGDLHVNADSLRLGDNNADATIATNGTGDLILTTHEGSATQGIIRLYDGANGNITLTPNGTGQVQVGSDQVVTLIASQTLTNKTLSSNSVWNGNTIGVAYGGTGSTTLTSGSYVVGNGTSAVTLKTPTQVTADLDTFTYQIGATAGKKGLVPAAPAIGASVVYLDQTGSWTTPSGSGTTTNALTIQSPLTGTSFNGSTAVTIGLGTVAVGNGGTGLTTLTAGYIPYGNGTSAFGSSANLFWDSANSRLGIGTASPYNKVEIEGASARLGLNNGGGASRKALLIEPLGYGGNTYARLESYDYGTSTGGILALNVTGGNVGIGTSSPALPLHIYNSGAALAYFETTNANGAYVIWRNSGTSIGDVGSGKGISGSGNATDFMIASRSTYPLLLGTGSAERMRIDSNGNVGIGVTPSAWYPSVYTAIDVGASSCFGGYASGASGDELTFVAGNVYFNSSNTPIYKANGFATNYRQFNGVHQWFNAPSGTAGNSITFTQAMTLDSSGNLGLGTASPAAKLDIAVSSTMGTYGPGTLNLKLRNTNTAETNSGALELLGHTGNASSPFPQGTISAEKQTSAGDGNYGSKLHLWTTSGGSGGEANSGQYRRLTIDSSGNVGIGTTSPSAKLDVNGQVRAAYASGFQVDNAGTMLGKLYYSGGLILDRAASTSLFIAQNGSNQVTLDSSGNLGIGGTASSGTRLYVVGSNTTSNTSIPIYANQVYGNTGVSSAALRLNLNDGAGGCYLYGYSGGAGFMHNAEYLAGTGWTARSTFASIMETTSSGFSFYLNSSLTAGNTFTPSERMRIDSSGNVGIGNTSPSEKLHVTGNIRASGVYVGNGSSGSYTKGFGGVQTSSASPTTPSGGSAGDHFYYY